MEQLYLIWIEFSVMLLILKVVSMCTVRIFSKQGLLE
jgi:hypothetical protein